MPRLRIIVGTLGGVGFAFLVGLVPPEILSWLREWSGRAGPDPDDPSGSQASRSTRRRVRRKTH